MPTFTGSFDNRQILLVAGVKICGTHGPSLRRYKALLDTGAQGTLISPKVVSEVGLTPTESRLIAGIDGNPIETEGYRISLDIPVATSMLLPTGESAQAEFSIGRDLDVALLPCQPSNHDVLLGMDFIGSLHLTIHGDNYIISY